MFFSCFLDCDMATNTYQFVWSADVHEICGADEWGTPIESKLYSAAANRVAYDFQLMLQSSAPGKRDLQLFMWSVSPAKHHALE